MMMHKFITSVVFWTVVVIIGTPLVFWYGPSAEERWLPVLSGQVATVTRDGNDLTFVIEVTKNRSCRLMYAGYSVVRGIERAPIIVRILDALPPPLVSLPLGRHILGPFAATLPAYFSTASYIEGVLYYECHPGWETRQVFGPVPIPPPASD